MLAWDTKRKIQYFSIIIGFILVFIILPFYFFIHTPPNCFDGVKNGKETGVDCGGDCRLICPAEALSPILRWDPRIFKISEGVYSVLAYIENPNVTAEVRLAPYTFKIHDRDGVLITERKGETFIPRGKTFAVFDGNFSTGDRIPFRAFFEFGPLTWTRATSPDPDIFVTNNALMNEETLPRVEATIQNREQNRIYNIELTAIIFDGAGNAIASSRTFVEQLDAGQSRNISFTWPNPFETSTRVCQSPVDIAVVIDRSGTMRSESRNPPQPLTSAKNAAKEFVHALSNADQVAYITFATDATVDRELSGDLSSVITAIDKTEIKTDGIQMTNFGDALKVSIEQLNSNLRNPKAKPVIVLLTDGDLADSIDPHSPNPREFPSKYALDMVERVKSSNIDLYAIGLGAASKADYLKGFASSPEHYFSAPTRFELSGIYKEIATQICQERPAVIEIIPRVYPR